MRRSFHEFFRCLFQFVWCITQTYSLQLSFITSYRICETSTAESLVIGEKWDNHCFRDKFMLHCHIVEFQDVEDIFF
jgi:hypothetical protein